METKARVKIPTTAELEQRVAAGNPFLTDEKWYAMFEDAVQKYMQMGAEEFIARWNAGEYYEIADTPGNLHIMELGMMIPSLVRENA